jgi:hypothetical protein
MISFIAIAAALALPSIPRPPVRRTLSDPVANITSPAPTASTEAQAFNLYVDRASTPIKYGLNIFRPALSGYTVKIDPFSDRIDAVAYLYPSYDEIAEKCTGNPIRIDSDSPLFTTRVVTVACADVSEVAP